MKRIRLWGLIAGLLLLLVGCGRAETTGVTKPVTTQGHRYIPTLFFHGWGSSYHSETHMADAIVKAGKTQTIVRAMVAKNGTVTLKGHFRSGDYRPIVEVNFANNRSSDYPTVGRWAKNVVVALQRTYGITSFNMVGHSMGNMAITYYLLANAQNERLPQLRQQVAIAGHFNGILGMDDSPNQMTLNAAGRPNKLRPAYRQLLGLRRVYPRQQVRVLNIYGDKGDGTHSDHEQNIVGVWDVGSRQLQIVPGKAKIHHAEVRGLFENDEAVVPNRQATLKRGDGRSTSGENVPDN
ncbi:alpha/beta hydrolase [Lactiplantibacillus plantarum]|uniref:alpha/beta hydrolase n=1 Tax=Lactiplantibacillus plantarum TaxID=1590 RepID=UPI002892A95F|nr:alpha/beta hydrolase [Lactiplantibacillus plantarum]WNJ65856.1 alpha/beta hydrolase [Lactiplantibacillus plantarum]